MIMLLMLAGVSKNWSIKRAGCQALCRWKCLPGKICQFFTGPEIYVTGIALHDRTEFAN
jgi:hypothetical protein